MSVYKMSNISALLDLGYTFHLCSNVVEWQTKPQPQLTMDKHAYAVGLQTSGLHFKEAWI